ncbi:VQ motif-containing protein 22-like [Gastrolobium bilobum]|uniref:VQ motif-containing protein 22-like n=1 Tax=Gastrolobium bilobum TaxID=150636 RepID=UPI002AB04B65|nr:VQ motif-containing protein 22-like [Gastrolobium bilobum]
MAMSDTMSGPNDWLHFYQQNLPAGQVLPSSVSEATTVTTTITTPTQLSPEGRVSKPIRRRSRASRRTPTTLLNTDTTNFRAMVQQFTGGPTAPFAPTASIPLPNLGFGFGSRPVSMNPNGLMLAPSGYHLEQQQQQQQQLYQQQNQHYISTSNREVGDNINNPTPPNVTDYSGIFMDHELRFFPSTSSS